MKTVLLVVAMLAIPVALFVVGAWIMTEVSGRQAVDSKPLNRRWGYQLKDAHEYWLEIETKQGTAGLKRELHLLRLDLAFPLAYGVGLAVSLLVGWTLLGRPFSPLWCLIPVVVGMVADWVENLIQIRQLKLFMAGEQISELAIGVASAATRMKLGALMLGAILVGCLALWTIRVSVRS